MNPELQRNFWLEYSHNRLIILPIVLGMLFYFVFLSSDAFGEAINILAKTCFVFFAVIWGSRQLSDAFIEEVRQHTWDWQRISSISPWSLLWGKWLGSTLYSWYGAILSLIMLMLSSPLNLHDTLYEVVAMISCALLGQGIALLVCLQMFKRDRTLMRFHSHLAHLGGIISALILLAIIFSRDNTWFDHWYAVQANNSTFVLLSLWAFCFWVILGNYRLIAGELQIRNNLWAWLSFMLFMLFYSSGMVQSPFSNLGFFTAIALSYLMLILEGVKPNLLRQLGKAVIEKDWLHVFQNMPCWLIGLIPATVYLVVLLILDTATKIPFIDADLRFFYVALLLFFLRDIGIVCWIQTGHKSKRNDASILLYLVVIYALVPALLTALGMVTLLQVFIPTPSIMSCLAAVVQILILMFILWPYIRPNASSKPTDPTHH